MFSSETFGWFAAVTFWIGVWYFANLFGTRNVRHIFHEEFEGFLNTAFQAGVRCGQTGVDTSNMKFIIKDN